MIRPPSSRLPPSESASVWGAPELVDERASSSTSPAAANRRPAMALIARQNSPGRRPSFFLGSPSLLRPPCPPSPLPGMIPHRTPIARSSTSRTSRSSSARVRHARRSSSPTARSSCWALRGCVCRPSERPGPLTRPMLMSFSSRSLGWILPRWYVHHSPERNEKDLTPSEAYDLFIINVSVSLPPANRLQALV